MEILKEIKAKHARHEIHQVTRKVLSNAVTQAEKQSFENQQLRLSNAGKYEGSNDLVTVGMIDMLQQIIENNDYNQPNESGGCIKSVKMGLFQADLLLAHRLKSKKPSIIVSRDSDFAMCLGVELIQLKKTEIWQKENERHRRDLDNFQQRPSQNLS